MQSKMIIDKFEIKCKLQKKQKLPQESTQIKMILSENELTSSILQNAMFQQLKAIISGNKMQIQQNCQKLLSACNLKSIEYQNFLSAEYQMISKQAEVLDHIRQEIIKKKQSSSHQILFCGSNNNNMDILPIQASFDMSNISSVQGYEDQPFKTKFGEQFQKSLLTSALNQIQQNCSSETFESIKNCVLNNKQKQFESAIEKLDKLTKKYEQLETSFIIKSTQLTQAQNQIKEAFLKIDQLDQQKRKIKLKANQLSEKQKRIYKMETSIVFKEKLFHEGKKRYERQKNLFLSIEERLNKLYKQMYSLWESVLKKMQQSQRIGCQINCQSFAEGGGCWKKQVMRKCKQQLIDQRNLLKEQQQEIQKQFQVIQLLSDQVRKLVNQKDSNANVSDPFSSEPSSLILDSNQNN